MEIDDKSKEQLIKELRELRQHIAELEKEKTERAIFDKEEGITHATARDIRERKEAYSILSEVFRFHELVLATLPVGVAAYDAEGQCISFNETGARLIGASRESALKQNFHQLESWKKSGLAEAAEKTIASGTNTRVLVHHITTFGRDIWMDCIFPLFMSGDKPHLLLVFSDVTENKRTENALMISEARFRSIVSTSQEWIWAIDSAGRHTFSNPAVEKILGYTPEEILWRDALHCSTGKTCRRSGNFWREASNRRPDKLC